MTVETADGDLLRLGAVGQHPYAAINRVVDHVRQRSWPPLIARHRLAAE
ncbi:MAG: hypothetical protein QM736_23370 [Vicinamibacterales bacterium]